jgi:ZIP family zinc transporter
MIAQDTTAGWFMVLISSMSCVLGASIVFLGKKVLESQSFLCASMALGGGVLVFNSLYTLLPASQQKLDSSVWTFACFFTGVLFTALLTCFIRWCTPKAIHTCSITKDSRETDITKPILSQHHHHVQEDLEYGTMTNSAAIDDNKSDYFLIGIQTAIAICIHKFPGKSVCNQLT